MPALGKTLSADAREFVSSGSQAGSEANDSSERGKSRQTSDTSRAEQQALDWRPPAPSEQNTSAVPRQQTTDRKAVSSDAQLNKKRSQSRSHGKAQRGAFSGPIPLNGQSHEPRPPPNGFAPPMVPNFMPAMPSPYRMGAGYQPGTAPMISSMDVPWMPSPMHHPGIGHMGYSMPVNMHTGALPLQPMPAQQHPGGMLPGMPFWGHPAGPVHAPPTTLQHRYPPHAVQYPMEEMGSMTLQPAGFPGMQEPQAPKAFMPGDHLGVSTHQWLPFRPGLDSREDSRLDKFKQCGAYRTWSYKDVRGHVVDFCKDKAGSHFIQSLLEEGTPEQVTGIINEAKEHMLILMKDAFGNYVVQKMLEKANAAEKKWMLHCICGDRPFPNRIVALSKDHHSCRVVQTALQVFDMKDKLEVMTKLLDGQNALDLVAEQNGNHVIQKCIECIKPASKLQPLVQALFNGKMSIPSRSPQGQTVQLKGSIISMCQNVYGCRVIQRLLMYADEETRAGIIEAVLKDVVANAVDTYSNYVIQHILVNGPEAARRYVWTQLGDHIMDLSRNKCASNVIEKCLATGNQEEVGQWVDTLCAKQDKLAELMKDQFGNYVCFTAFLKAEEAQRQVFAEVIRWSLHALRSSTYGKNYLIKLVVSSETSSYFTAEELGVTPADIDKFKKMQQTAQSNRAGNKASPVITLVVKPGASKAAPETTVEGDAAAGAENIASAAPAPVTPSTPLNPPSSQNSSQAMGSEACITQRKTSIRDRTSLPPNGLSGRHNQGRRHTARLRDQPQGHKVGGQTGDSFSSSDGAGAEIEVGSECTATAEVTRHGSFEKDLVKLPRTRSHAKSESDLERPHQVSVTADGAGPPVTRAPIGS